MTVQPDPMGLLELRFLPSPWSLERGWKKTRKIQDLCKLIWLRQYLGRWVVKNFGKITEFFPRCLSYKTLCVSQIILAVKSHGLPKAKWQTETLGLRLCCHWTMVAKVIPSRLGKAFSYLLKGECRSSYGHSHGSYNKLNYKPSL